MTSGWEKFGLKDKTERLQMLKKEKFKKDQLLIFFLLGVLLLVIAVPVGKKPSDSGRVKTEKETGKARAEEGTMTEQDYISYMEKNLENILSQMKGVGEVTVMITLKESSEKVIEKDVETASESVSEEDSQGGKRTTRSNTLGETTIYNGEEESGQSPYVRKEKTPRVEGVVVVAQGGDNALVIRNITESVQALFGIDTHKIRIVKKE